MKIIIANHTDAHELKSELVEHLNQKGYHVIDAGPKTKNEDFSHIDAALAVSKAINEKQAQFGIALCGSGMGVALIANKQKGIYAALVESEFTAKQARLINNANVIAMGSLVQTPFMAKKLVDLFLETEFPSKEPDLASAYQQMQAIEQKNFK